MDPVSVLKNQNEDGNLLNLVSKGLLFLNLNFLCVYLQFIEEKHR